MTRNPSAVVLLLLACAPCAHFASGATYDWITTPSGTFGNGVNWSPVGPPGPLDTARFALASTYSITFAGHANISVHTQSAGDITMYLNGWTYQATNTTNNGIGGNASLKLTNGNFQPGNFSIGGAVGNNSSLTLDTLCVTSVGAGVFYVGTSGTGNLSVQNGAVLTTNTTGLGLNSSGVGSATVTGSGSSWTANAAMRVGSSGTGILNVRNGAVVTATALEVGEYAGSTGTLSLSGAGAAFTTSGTANIGGASAGFLAQSATVNLAAGASLNLNGTTNFRSTATVNITGGTLNLATLNVSPGAAVNWSGGRVNFANGSAITAPVLDLFLAGTHTLGANQTLSAVAGTMNLNSPLAVTGGTLEVLTLDINAPLNIGAFGTVMVDTMSIQSGQTVQIENMGALVGATMAQNSGGLLEMKGSQATVDVFLANNFGTVQGTGRFKGGMNNGTGGNIRLRTGDHLIVHNVGQTNSGIIDLAGGMIEYTHTLSNLGTGSIVGRGVFRGSASSPGGNGLSNIGVIALSGGTTDFHGDVINSGAGKIVASGASVVTFFDDVTHNGSEIRTNAGSRTVFFGALTGAGPFTGTGVVEVNGDLKPGNSPSLVTFDGDVEFASTTRLYIELGGTTAGTGYDQISIAGTLLLNGGLNVAFIGGFVPAMGDTFDVLDWGTLTGTFSNVNLPVLAGGLQWKDDNLYSTGTLQVVPEPGMLPVMAALSFAMLRRSRRSSSIAGQRQRQ